MDMYKQEFIQALAFLKEYLDQIIITGGWLPLIYRDYVVEGQTRPSLMTNDIDIVVPDKLEPRGEKTLDKLLIDSGFVRRHASLDTQTAVSYEKRVGELDIQIEFLANLKASGSDVVVEAQAGLHAQALRYISILRDNAMEIEMHDSVPSCGTALTIKVPRPGAYIFQKGLTFARRRHEEKKAKDLYYIFDVLTLDEPLSRRISDEILQIRSKYPAKWFARFLAQLEGQFADEASAGPAYVSRQRPLGAFPDLNEPQFRMYVTSVFHGFLADLLRNMSSAARRRGFRTGSID